MWPKQLDAAGSVCRSNGCAHSACEVSVLSAGPRTHIARRAGC